MHAPRLPMLDAEAYRMHMFPASVLTSANEKDPKIITRIPGKFEATTVALPAESRTGMFKNSPCIWGKWIEVKPKGQRKGYSKGSDNFVTLLRASVVRSLGKEQKTGELGE